MTKTTKLTRKQEELKSQLAANEYTTAVNLMVISTNRLVQKLTRKPQPLPFWYGTMVIALATLTIGFLASILLNENSETLPRFFRLEKGILLEFLEVVIVFSLLIGHKVYSVMFFSTLRNHLLEIVELSTDLSDLHQWLTTNRGVKKPVVFGFAFGIFFCCYLSILISIVNGGFIGFGIIVLNLIIGFQSGMVVYYFFLFSLFFPVRFSRYRLKLYMANPSNSKALNYLSDTLTIAMYITAIITAFTTYFFSFFELLSLPGLIFLLLFAWGPLIFSFLAHQYTLSKIITRTKWEGLNEIQLKIETLQLQEDIPTKDTLAHIRALIDYHDHIKATRNTMFDFRAGLNFLNSLLLPLIAFLLANLDRVFEIFN